MYYLISCPSHHTLHGILTTYKFVYLYFRSLQFKIMNTFLNTPLNIFTINVLWSILMLNLFFDKNAGTYSLHLIMSIFLPFYFSMSFFNPNPKILVMGMFHSSWIYSHYNSYIIKHTFWLIISWAELTTLKYFYNFYRKLLKFMKS